MPVLVKNLEIAHDPWTLIDSSDDRDRAAGDGCIVPFDDWASPTPGSARVSLARESSARVSLARESGARVSLARESSTREHPSHGTNVSGERQRPGAVGPWATSGAGPQAEPKAPAVGHSQATRSSSRAGFWVDGEADVEQVGDHLEGASIVAVKFPAFADGRGLSLGVLLRSRYGFGGELRAFGDILPDLAQYLHRSGFDAFVVDSHRAAEVAIASVRSISDHYQASVLQPQPAFRRMHTG